MVKKLTLIFTVAIALLACKKKTAEPEPVPNTTTTSQTALVELYKGQYFDGTNYVANGENVNITFVNLSTSPPTPEIYAGNIIFNGTGLNYDGFSYTDTTYAINYSVPVYSLNVSGSGQISGFSTTFSPSYPVFTGDALLPTTVSKSTGFTINLGSSMSNMNDTARIELLGSAIKKIAPGQTSVTFTPTDISGIMVANGYYFDLEMINNQTLNVNGNSYYIRNELHYTKYNINVVP